MVLTSLVAFALFALVLRVINGATADVLNGTAKGLNKVATGLNKANTNAPKWLQSNRHRPWNG